MAPLLQMAPSKFDLESSWFVFQLICIFKEAEFNTLKMSVTENIDKICSRL